MIFMDTNWYQQCSKTYESGYILGMFVVASNNIRTYKMFTFKSFWLLAFVMNAIRMNTPVSQLDTSQIQMMGWSQYVLAFQPTIKLANSVNQLRPMIMMSSKQIFILSLLMLKFPLVAQTPKKKAYTRRA